MECKLSASQEKFLDFVVEVVKKGHKLTKDQMQFAYIIGYCGMDMTIDEAVELVNDPDSTLKKITD